MIQKDLREIIVNNENDRMIEGYASVEILDRQNDIVPIETMEKAMLNYMKRGGLLMFGHENKPIGRVIQWNIEDNPSYNVPAVKIIGLINTGFQLDDQVWSLIQKKELKGFSIGGNAIKVGQAQMRDNTTARVLEEIELSEISVVTEPANQGAIISSVSIAKNINIEKIADELMVNKKSYPWETCIRENTARYGSAKTARKVCGAIRSKYGKGVMEEKPPLLYLDLAVDYAEKNIDKTFNKEYPFARCVYNFVNKGYSFQEAQKTCTLIKWGSFKEGIVELDFAKLESKMPTDFKNSCVRAAEASGVPSDKSGNICELIYRKYLNGNAEEANKMKEGFDDGSIPFPKAIYEREYYLYKPDYYWDVTVRGHRPPEFFWNTCKEVASGVDFIEGVPRGAERFCGFLFYHKFGGNDGVANKWAKEANISYDDLKKWWEHHQQKVGNDSTVPFPEVPDEFMHAVVVQELPPSYWYEKMVKKMDGDRIGTLLLYYQNKGKVDVGIQKGVKVEYEPISPSVLWLYKNSESFKKAIDGIVEISKPFAGYKNFAACERSNSKKYGKKGAQRVCGYLKHKTEKGTFKKGDEEVIDKVIKFLKRWENEEGDVKCPYCKKMIPGVYEAALHVMDEHPETVVHLYKGVKKNLNR